MKILCLNCMKEYEEEYGVCPSCGFIPGTPPNEAYHLYPGTMLKNRYIVGTTVGFGGFGITYRAWDNVLAKKVAIKEYYPNGIVNRVPGERSVIVYSGNRADEFRNGKKRFLDEARNMARFNTHPNIVNVYEFFEENNTAYIAMEFLEGVSYKQYIADQGGSVPPETAVSVVVAVLDALKEIHKAGIIHRDVSPDNIFMVPMEEGAGRYRVKLIDFGAARFSTGEEEKTLSIILKPGYAPPEQYRSKSKQGPWTDIYAVGAVLYRSITGRMPEESVNRMVEDHLEPPSVYAPGLPQYLDDTILRAMALNQELRFRNVDQFRDALQNKSKVLGVSGELKRRKRLRVLSIAAVAAVLLAAGLACRGIWLHKQNGLYHVAAALSVAAPDMNGERQKEIDAAGRMGADGEDSGQKQLSMEGTDEMFGRLFQEYGSRFSNVSVEQVQPEAPDAYAERLRTLAKEGSLPSVMETDGIGPEDTEIWEQLGTLDTTYGTLSAGEYYFMEQEEFRETFLKEKRQIPVSFRAPVLYVNTHMITDSDRLDSLEELDSLSVLTDEDGRESFCVSADAGDMYRAAFSDGDTAGSMEAFAALPEGGKGYEPFLNREKAFYLGTTDDYESIRASMGGIYRMVVLKKLQEAGRVKGQFTHLWSISGALTGDEKTAADSLVCYLMSENAQDIFNLQDGNGLSLSRSMLQTYAEGNDEFREVADALDSLQMEY